MKKIEWERLEISLRKLQMPNRCQTNISCKDVHNKDRSSMNLTEGEVIKERWQEYIGKLYKKGLNDPYNQGAVITHLEP